MFFFIFLFLSICIPYMFLPLWAIVMWNIQLVNQWKLKHLYFRMFSIQSLATNSGCLLVHIKYRHP
jgi:hypothetical protein